MKINVESYTFKAVVEPDFFEDGTPAYHAYIPALPGCFSWGYTVEEALHNLEATATYWLELMRERGEPIPNAGAVSTDPHIAVNLVRP
ncbi:MAG: type II toxin-antitoxin system HicB family antitoxin [Candidatus Bipolaricaulota bacterium]|nr:type II toxin-antitoxin system HicB family antitoxin [Candidatus Bipolaricaulota bacterium]MCS7274236.1 type II toxin-antitoxin system HicB family antitoxin [Candidatus Bipolaricaulota bacterium]MDW8110512.1 type II toxin-antitoxin system HicB family antitoxin [Candidatus Bipolaricaulota bacterium]